VVARASEAERHALIGFAQDLGLAYQITGDLQDAEAGDTCEPPERPPTDHVRGKSSYVSLLGAPGARERLGVLAAQTKAHLDPFGERAIYLRDCVDFVMELRA
jgi:farnesyl diphosphate synthase